MTTTTFRKLILPAALFALACGGAFAQQLAPSADSGLSDEDQNSASFVIFSNLSRTPGDRFRSGPGGFPVAGRDAFLTEESNAIRFVPKVDVQAKVLAAAITYTSGTKLVTLGIFSNNDLTGSVGDPLPGGQGSTSQIPDDGECCRLATVTLADGVTLTKGTTYWLVASPDNMNAPDFRGTWNLSYLASFASFTPDAG